MCYIVVVWVFPECCSAAPTCYTPDPPPSQSTYLDQRVPRTSLASSPRKHVYMQFCDCMFCQGSQRDGSFQPSYQQVKSGIAFNCRCSMNGRLAAGRAPAARCERRPASRRRRPANCGPPKRGRSEKGEVLLRGGSVLRGVGTLRYLLILSENSACQVPFCAVAA